MQESENKIAVIAVHGVAYHAPGQSVRDIAGVLSSLSDTANYLKYSPFTQEILRIAVREVDGVLLETMPGSGGDDIAFTRRLLQGYRPGGSEAIYETTCLRGHRVCRDKGESVRQIPVDVYEMYWNDLSKVAGGKLGPLNTLYLLLFHLCDLGLNTIQNSTKSTVWERLFKAARCLLTVIIPQGNLLLLMLFLGVIPLGLKSAELIRAVTVLGAVLGTGGLGYIAYRFRRYWLKNAWGFFWVLVAGIALGGVGFITFGFLASPSPYLSATLLGGTGTAVALAFLFKRFESFRRASSLYGRVLLSLIWAGLLSFLHEYPKRGFPLPNLPPFSSQRLTGKRSSTRVAPIRAKGSPVSLYTGHLFDSNVAVILPKNQEHVTAIWCFCSGRALILV